MVLITFPRISDSRSVAAEDTDIVEELAALNLPEVYVL